MSGPLPGPGHDEAAEELAVGWALHALEPEDAAFLNHGDNLAMAPNGDLLVCEDNAEIQHLQGPLDG